MNKFLCSIILILPLAACSSKHWEKPGASQYDTSSARADCVAQSYDKYPVNMKQSFDLDLKSLTKNDPLNSLKIKENDLNQDARDAFVTSCMYKKGWSLVDR
ncbi:hypothetical protein HX362_004612 [Salmonella enterica]|nr:hypothetical protein [Salmonella enterica]